MTARGTVLVVGSSATVLQLRGGRAVPTGNYLNEMLVPMQALQAAGYQLLVATPGGMKPPLDGRSLSVSHFAGDEVAFESARQFYERDSSFRETRTLRAVIDDGLERIAGVLVPGGHAPITDLAANPELGEVLRHAHQQLKPTAMICHGPIAALSAMLDAASFLQALIAGRREEARAAARTWPYRGYEMTIFSRSEEAPVEQGVFGAPLLYTVSDALRLAGGEVSQGAVDYQPHVVADRELITGQNPRSDHQLAARFIEALDRRTSS
jgi:putative intracellular protease/amidase